MPGGCTNLAVNVLLPWLHARATAADNDGLAARVAERYFAWPKAQDNSRLKFVRQRLFGGRRVPLHGAALQHRLLQVQADFCNRTNALCEDCAFPDLVRRYSLLKYVKNEVAIRLIFGRLLFRFSGSGCSSVGRASPCQGDCREFESHHPLHFSSIPLCFQHLAIS